MVTKHNVETILRERDEARKEADRLRSALKEMKDWRESAIAQSAVHMSNFHNERIQHGLTLKKEKSLREACIRFCNRQPAVLAKTKEQAEWFAELYRAVNE